MRDRAWRREQLHKEKMLALRAAGYDPLNHSDDDLKWALRWYRGRVRCFDGPECTYCAENKTHKHRKRMPHVEEF